jgi:hypothetical protein
MQATFELLTFPSLRLVAKVPFAAAPAAWSWQLSTQLSTHRKLRNTLSEGT